MELETMRLVMVESPFAGDIERNVNYARACMPLAVVVDLDQRAMAVGQWLTKPFHPAIRGWPFQLPPSSMPFLASA